MGDKSNTNADTFALGTQDYWAGVLGGDEPPLGLSEAQVVAWKEGWLAGFDQEWGPNNAR